MTRSLLTGFRGREAGTRMVERGVAALVVLDRGAVAAALTERDVLEAVACCQEGECSRRGPDDAPPGDDRADGLDRPCNPR